MEKKDEDEKEEFLPGYKTVQEFSTDGFKRVMHGVKAFQALPQPGPSWDLHKSYPEFSRSMKQARAKIVPMMASLLKHVNIPTSDFRSRDVDEKFEFLVECNDDLLERIGSSLDEAEGLFTKSEMVVMDKGLAATSLKAPGTWGKRKLNEAEEPGDSKSKAQDISKRQMKKATYRLRVMDKPQLKFSVPIDNSTAPFVPKLKEKPHSIKPLSILPEYTQKNEEFYGHPYLVELNRWEPRDDMLTKVNPQLPKILKDTPLVFVNNARDLERMMYDLLDKKEIAVDLEHHSYRTYLGLTCLMQLSSTEKDYVIDGLALRDDLYHLNEVLTDPKVLKVFHGSSSDIDWLQRDFGLYVVNMFDTYVAAKALGLPQCSLQYLLGKYCNVTQNKSLQLADWRIRPLPNEMLEYARQDTHYLIYIYECMRNELIDAGNQHNNLLLSVYDQSRLACLKRYEKPVSNAQLALRKARRTLNNRQLYAFTEIYKWRDEIAREKDESLGFVLPSHMLLTIAETLPKEMNGILACCDPVPPLLTSNLGKIHKIITTARELPLHQQSVQKDKTEKKVKQKKWVVAVNSIHDMDLEDGPESSKGNSYEDEEVIPSKTDDNITWPEPWTDPGEWKSLIKDKPTSWNFGRRTKARPQMSLSSLSVGLDINLDSFNTPNGRYEASKKILDILKDPQGHENVDLNDPVVKAVYEAVTVVDESEKISEEAEEAPPQQLSKVLDEGEFIPFNPLAEPKTNIRKRRGKKKRASWEDLKAEKNQGEDDQCQDVLGAENQNESDDDSLQNVDSPTKSSPLLNVSKEKRNKRKKGKLLNRLKNVFSKNKTDKSEDSTEVIEIIDDDEPVDEAPGPSSKKSKSFKSNQHASPPRKRARGASEQSSSNNRHYQKNTPNQKRDGRHKNKSGIFKAFKRDNNKSVTFK